jgi:hypothetical protein
MGERIENVSSFDSWCVMVEYILPKVRQLPREYSFDSNMYFQRNNTQLYYK